MKTTYGLTQNIEQFIRAKQAEQRRPRTLEWYREKLGGFIRYATSQGVESVLDITPHHIREFLIYLRDKGHNEGGCHGYYQALKAFLFFFDNEYEPEGWRNPIRKVKAPSVSMEPIVGISLEEFEVLYDACDNRTFFGERDKALLSILIDTGVRAGELTQMNIEDVNFSDSSILIRKSKVRKPRSVFMGKKARRQVRRYLNYVEDDMGPLFISKQGDRLTYSGTREIIRRLSVRAGMKEPGLHDFRRTFAVTLLKKKVDIATISRLLGHSNIATTARYLAQSRVDIGEAYRSVLDD